MTRERPAGAYRRLAWTAAAATLALITLGGVVRITGSGLGCGDDWPLCHGRLIPPLDLPTLIEYAHRLAASLVSLLTLGLLALAWIRHRGEPRLRRPATLAALLLAFQVLLGAVTVWLRLPAASVVLHLATAMVLLGVLVVAALRAGQAARPGAVPDGSGEREIAGVGPRYAALTRAAAALGFGTLVVGGVVANLHAGSACQGFPLCNGALLPAAELPVAVHWTHRLFAFTLVGLLGVAFVVPRVGGGDATSPARRRVRRLSAFALALGAAQVAVAAAMVLFHLPPVLRAFHLAVGALLWVVLVALAYACPRAAHVPQAPLRFQAAGDRATATASSSAPDPARRARRADVHA